MSGSRAKKIRKEVYGEKDFRKRSYIRGVFGNIKADEKRQEYQERKGR
jgi:hypothetical protein